MAWWYLLLLAAAGVVGYAIWNFRRKAAERRTASAARIEKLLKGEVAASASPNPPSSVPAELSAAASASSAMPAAPLVATERFLGPPESLLYYLLKAGLPDCEVFAGVSLARVVRAAGTARDREQQLRRLAQYQLDFVICDRA